MNTVRVQGPKDLEVGDKVLISGNTAGSRNSIGDVGIVKNLAAHDCQVEVDGKPFNGRGNYSALTDLEKILDEAEEDVIEKIQDVKSWWAAIIAKWDRLIVWFNS